jgi:hypothetical protein
MTKQFNRLWSVVKKLILREYDVLVKRYMRGSYYIIGDILAPLIGKEITLEDYNWFGTDQGYATYRDDVWTLIEQQHDLQRPETAAIGIVYDNGIEYPISRLEHVWDQARGFIFVEKADGAKDLADLSSYGWVVVAGRGYPLRLVRKLLKHDQRPILALHDWDRDGLGVYKALGFETRRTRHLNIALGQRVTDLGLTECHVKVLKLPTRPSPPKYKGAPRVELSGLDVLATRMNLENPVLAYTVATLLAKGLTLSPTEMSRTNIMQRHIRWALTDGLSNIVEEAVKEVTETLQKDRKFQGTAVKGELEDMKIIAPGLREKLVQSALIQAEKTHFVDELSVHAEAVDRFGKEKLIAMLRKCERKTH